MNQGGIRLLAESERALRRKARDERPFPDRHPWIFGGLIFGFFVAAMCIDALGDLVVWLVR